MLKQSQKTLTVVYLGGGGGGGGCGIFIWGGGVRAPDNF